ncbi:MAG: hypothetical protein D8M58_07600 [Calditrichaeota bacterium]|nr:MAG: hypothetical protein DWQ03_18890 [Calditrichota bacterium]MBL1205245.1 hypothetical protein [Calditrichota bacterium]NOG45074.1 hypothetical protein [Calditrichota bacterium]
MSIAFYNVLHVIGIIMLFLGIGGAIVRSYLAQDSPGLEKLVLINHGVGLLLILIAGFGQLAKIGMQFSSWVVVKIIIWLFMGSLIMFIKKKPELKSVWWYGALVMGGLAAYLGIYKPF